MPKHKKSFPITLGVYVIPVKGGKPARVVKWLRKHGVLLLDRQTGGYWTYPPSALTVLTPQEAHKVILEDLRKGKY